MPDTPTEPVDNTKDALFRALRLKAADAPPTTQANNEPVPDSGNGIEVPTNGVNRPSLGDMIKDLTKAPATPAPEPPVAAPATPPDNAPSAPPAAPPVAATPAPVVTPPAAPTPPATPPEDLVEKLRKKLGVPEVPRPVEEPEPTQTRSVGLDLSGLEPDEVDAVQLAHFAETQNPTRYAGHARRTLDHIKQVKAYRQQKVVEDPSIEFDENNYEYQSLLRRAPGYERGDQQRLERKRLAEEIRQETLKEVAAKQQRLEQELRNIKAQPLVEKRVKDFEEFIDSQLPINSDDILEADTAKDIKRLANGAAREFMLISTQLAPFDPKNETHQWLAKFIQEQGEVLANSDAPQKKRGDKTFVPRAAYNSMPQAEKDKHFTFTDQEVLELIGINAKLAANEIVKAERTKLERLGYSRAPKTVNTPPPAAPVTPPQPSPTPNGVVQDISPRGGVTPVSGGFTPVGSGAPADPFLKHLMSKSPTQR